MGLLAMAARSGGMPAPVPPTPAAGAAAPPPPPPRPEFIAAAAAAKRFSGCPPDEGAETAGTGAAGTDDASEVATGAAAGGVDGASADPAGAGGASSPPRSPGMPYKTRVRGSAGAWGEKRRISERTVMRYSTARSGLLNDARRAFMTWSFSKPISIILEMAD